MESWSPTQTTLSPAVLRWCPLGNTWKRWYSADVIPPRVPELRSGLPAVAGLRICLGPAQTATLVSAPLPPCCRRATRRTCEFYCTALAIHALSVEQLHTLCSMCGLTSLRTSPLSSPLDRALEPMASVKYVFHFMSMSHASFRFVSKSELVSGFHRMEIPRLQLHPQADMAPILLGCGTGRTRSTNGDTM